MSLSKDQFVDILESMSDGFISMDKQLVVIYFNKAAEKMLGRSREEVLGKNLFEAFPEAKGSLFEEKYKEAVKTKKQRSFETFFEVPPYTNWYDGGYSRFSSACTCRMNMKALASVWRSARK